MYTISKYLDETRRLASSLIVKHHDIGIVINQGLLRQYGIASSNDYTTWKYYLNLSGVSHSTNNKVYFTPIESNTPVLLSVSSLGNYPKTHASLETRSKYYDLLIDKYPDDVLYINGCINPIDLNTAINAVDGTILGSVSKYIEPQEYSLIREVSSEVQLFFTRWYIKDYNITDELYMASVLAVLYSALPNILVNIRTSRAWSIEAHSFHIEHFFRSHLDLWDNVKELGSGTIGWLHKNLLVLMNNVGSNETLNSVITKIFTPNNIGLARYSVTPSAITQVSTAPQPLSSFLVGDVSIIIEKLNSSYTRNSMTIPLVDVIKKEIKHSSIALSADSNIINNLTQHENIRLGKSSGVTQYTKVIDFGELNLFRIYTNNLIETILDNWLYLSNGTNYTYSKKYTDPVTSLVYNLDSRTAIILFYRLLIYKLNGTDPVISDIKYRYNVVNTIDKNTLNSGLLNSVSNGAIIDTIVANLPVANNSMTTVASFTVYIEQQIMLYKKIWVLDSNVNNSFLSANIKKILNGIYSEGSIRVANTPTPMSAILVNAGVNISLTNGYDVDLAITTLFKTFTGYDLHTDTIVSELYSNFEIILEKLCSYSIQTVPPVINNSDLNVPYTTLSALYGDVGYIEVTSGQIIKVLEDSPKGTIGIGNDFSENFDPTGVTVPALSVLASTNNINIAVTADPAKDLIVNSTPTAYAEIVYPDYVVYTPANKIYANNIPTNTAIPNNGGTTIRVAAATQDSNPLIALTSDYLSDVVVDIMPSMHTEILRYDYNVYIPTINAVSPNATGYTPLVASVRPMIGVTSTSLRQESLIGYFDSGKEDVTVSGKPNIYAEILYSDYSVFAPTAIAKVHSPGVTDVLGSNIGNIANITTVTSRNDIIVTSNNNTVTHKPVANAEVLGRPPVV